MNKVKILGTGYAKAQKKITNFDLEKKVNTSDEWISQRTGISSRYVSETENTSDLGVRAALQAISNAHIQKEDIDAIFVATMTPDYMTPSTACLIQAKLGLNNQKILTMDINAACSGFLYAFQVACEMLDRFSNILIIGSETMSKVIDWTNRETCVLFGDGAGAMVITKGTHEVYHYANSQGDMNHVLYTPGLPLIKNLDNSNPIAHHLSMQGKEVFRFAINALQESIQEVLKQSQLQIEDIQCIIPHQANYRIISHVARKMKIDISQFYINLDEFGNTSAASIAIAYAQAIEKGVIHHQDHVIFVGFGSGLTYGATLMKGETK